AGRFTRLTFSDSPAFLVILAGFAVFYGMSPFALWTAPSFIWAFVILARLIAAVYSAEVHEFLLTRPFDGGRRFVGGVLFPSLFLLLAPLTALCFVNLHWIERGGLFGHPPSTDAIRYMREVLGATFLPDTWPRAGLPQHLWAQLRPLLYLDVLRVTLVILSILFIFPIRQSVVGSNDRPVPVGSVLIFLVAVWVMARVHFLDAFAAWPMPRLPFFALLAGVSIAHFWWLARQMSAPPRARPLTDSSTRG
ncbi:MAG TPA: hypothetical protein VIF57_22645, partial [Polyangia bacterium]